MICLLTVLAAWLTLLWGDYPPSAHPPAVFKVLMTALSLMVFEGLAEVYLYHRYWGDEQ